MATLWDREVSDDVKPGLEQLPPVARLELVLHVLEWTIEALPASSRALLAEEAGKTVDSATGWIRRSVAGEDVSDLPEDLVGELFEWRDDLRLVDLWQLFTALNWCVGVPAAETTVDTAVETISACYDVVRDCEDLPEFLEEVPEEKMFGAERANANCMAAIAKQKEMVREAVGRMPRR